MTLQWEDRKCWEKAHNKSVVLINVTTQPAKKARSVLSDEAKEKLAQVRTAFPLTPPSEATCCASPWVPPWGMRRVEH